MKKLLTAALILLFCGSAFANGTDWFKGSFEEAKAAAKKKGKHILIHFYAPG